MNNREKILVDKFVGYKEIELRAAENAQNVLNELAMLAPHNVGEIVKWIEERRKNVGSFFHPHYVTMPPVEKKAVLTSVKAKVNIWTKGEVTLRYDYTFRLIKKDGTICQQICHPHSDYEWTNEVHKDYQK